MCETILKLSPDFTSASFVQIVFLVAVFDSQDLPSSRTLEGIGLQLHVNSSCLRARVDVKFLIHPSPISIDGVVADAELVRNFFAKVALGEQVVFSLGQFAEFVVFGMR